MSGVVWSTGIGAAGGTISGPAEQRVDDTRLRRACAELESVFLNELLKLMRESVPESGLVSGGTGEEIFTSLLDQHIAVQAAERMERGLGAALYRHFRAAAAAAAHAPERGGADG